MKRIASAAAAALALVGCGGAAQPAELPTPTPTQYQSVTDLRDAAIAAGYACPSWQQHNRVKLASQSGSCTTADVFAVYLSPEATQDQVSAAKELGMEMHWLVGSNWTINAPVDALPALQDALGGMVVESS